MSCFVFCWQIHFTNSSIVHIFPTTFMLRVSFSPAPVCVEGDCWNRCFSTPPWAEKAPLLLLLLLCCTFTKIIKPFRWILPIYFCAGFSAWKPIITTQRFLRFFMILSFFHHFGAISWIFWNLAVAMHLEKWDLLWFFWFSHLFIISVQFHWIFGTWR